MLEIKKIGVKNFFHYWETTNKTFEYSASDLDLIYSNSKVFLRSISKAVIFKKEGFSVNEIKVYDVGGSAEVFSNYEELQERLIELGHPAYTGFTSGGDVSLDTDSYKLITSDFDWSTIPDSYSNCKLDIKHDFDLDGTIVNFPDNVTLLFNGGSFANGTLIGNNTKIDAQAKKIFNNITLDGSFNAPTSYIEWVGCVGDAKTTSTEFTVNSISFYADKWNGTDNTPLIPKILNLIYKVESDFNFLDTYYFETSTTAIIEIENLENRSFNGGGFIGLYFILKDSKNIKFDNVDFFGKVRPFDLPFKLVVDTEKRYDSGFMYVDDFINEFFTTGTVRFDTDINGSENSYISNCYVENRTGGFFCISQNENMINTGFTVVNCQFKFMWQHGVSSRYTKNVTVSNCVIDKSFQGMLYDSSRGTINSVVSNNTMTNTTKSFKFESDGITALGTSVNGVFSGNIFKGWEVNPFDDYDEIDILSVLGDGDFIVSDNVFETWNTVNNGFNMSASNTLFLNNAIKINNNFSGILFYGAGGDDKTILKNNKVYGAEISSLIGGTIEFKENTIYNTCGNVYISGAKINCIDNYFYSVNRFSSTRATGDLFIIGNTFENVIVGSNIGFLSNNTSTANKNILVKNNNFLNVDKSNLFLLIANGGHRVNLVFKDNFVRTNGSIVWAYSESDTQGLISYDVNGNNIDFIEDAGQGSYLVRAEPVFGNEKRVFANNVVNNNSSLDLEVVTMLEFNNQWNKKIDFTYQSSLEILNKSENIFKIEEKTGTTYTFNENDDVVVINNASFTDAEIPLNATKQLNIGIKIEVVNISTVDITITGESGVTLINGGVTLLVPDGEKRTLLKIDTNKWLVSY